MKKLILPFMLLILFSTSSSAKHAFKHLEGTFIDMYHDIKVKVKAKNDGVKIKGIPGIRGWREFHHHRANRFIDHRGNSISFNSRNRINVKMGYSRLGSIKLFRKGHYNYHNEHYNEYGRKNGKRDRDYYNDGYNDYRKDDRRSRYDRNDGRNYGYQDFSGTWYSSDTRLNVIIENNNNGIRARLQGKNDWTYYNLTENGLYQDKSGNTYNMLDRDTLVWENRKRTKQFRLTR